VRSSTSGACSGATTAGCGADAGAERGKTMTVDGTFERHSTTEDNEVGIATGWNLGRLPPSEWRWPNSSAGGDTASSMRSSPPTCVERSRPVDRVPRCKCPALPGWRLRECNYGTCRSVHRRSSPPLGRWPCPRDRTYGDRLGAPTRVGRHTRGRARGSPLRVAGGLALPDPVRLAIGSEKSG
jgi:hypothetical protein